MTASNPHPTNKIKKAERKALEKEQKAVDELKRKK